VMRLRLHAQNPEQRRSGSGPVIQGTRAGDSTFDISLLGLRGRDVSHEKRPQTLVLRAHGGGKRARKVARTSLQRRDLAQQIHPIVFALDPGQLAERALQRRLETSSLSGSELGSRNL